MFAVLLMLAAFFCGMREPAVANSSSPGAAKAEPRTTGIRGGKLTYRQTSAPRPQLPSRADEATIVTSFFMLTSRLSNLITKPLKYVPGLPNVDDGRGRETLDISCEMGSSFPTVIALNTDDVIFTPQCDLR